MYSQSRLDHAMENAIERMGRRGFFGGTPLADEAAALVDRLGELIDAPVRISTDFRDRDDDKADDDLTDIAIADLIGDGLDILSLFD